MAFSRPETKCFNSYVIPEDLHFRTWLQQDAHFSQVARDDTRNVQRVIRLLDLPTAFENVNPDHPLDHRDRLALTLRYIGERYDEQDIFNTFGVNRRTQRLFTLTAREPRLIQPYEKLQNLLSEMSLRRQKRVQRREEARCEETLDLAELAEVPVPV